MLDNSYTGRVSGNTDELIKESAKKETVQNSLALENFIDTWYV